MRWNRRPNLVFTVTLQRLKRLSMDSVRQCTTCRCRSPVESTHITVFLLLLEGTQFSWIQFEMKAGKSLSILHLSMAVCLKIVDLGLVCQSNRHCLAARRVLRCNYNWINNSPKCVATPVDISQHSQHTPRSRAVLSWYPYLSLAQMPAIAFPTPFSRSEKMIRLKFSLMFLHTSKLHS